MRKKYRYIGNGMVTGKDRICDYRLIGGNLLSSLISAYFIRVHIPDDMVLEKWRCDSYSTTRDQRTIEELGYDVVVKINGKWKIMNELKDVEPHKIREVLHYKYNLNITKEHGYLNPEQYVEYLRNLQTAIDEAAERANENKRALDNHEMFVDDLEYLDKKDILRVLKLYVREKTGRSMV